MKTSKMQTIELQMKENENAKLWVKKQYNIKWIIETQKLACTWRTVLLSLSYCNNVIKININFTFLFIYLSFFQGENASICDEMCMHTLTLGVLVCVHGSSQKLLSGQLQF